MLAKRTSIEVRLHASAFPTTLAFDYPKFLSPSINGSKATQCPEMRFSSRLNRLCNLVDRSDVAGPLVTILGHCSYRVARSYHLIESSLRMLLMLKPVCFAVPNGRYHRNCAILIAFIIDFEIFIANNWNRSRY